MEYTYNIEELKNTYDYYNNIANNIINEAISVMPKFIDGDMLQRYREYIEKNNFDTFFSMMLRGE